MQKSKLANFKMYSSNFTAKINIAEFLTRIFATKIHVVNIENLRLGIH